MSTKNSLAAVNPTQIKESDRLSIFEFADLFGFTPSALIEAIQRNRLSLKKPYYTIQDLADRWNCSRASVYVILRESEFKLFDMSRGGRNKGKRNVPAAVVEKIEHSRMRALESVA